MYLPGKRNIPASSRLARGVAGLALLGLATAAFVALFGPGLPRVYRFILFFVLFPALWLLLEALAGFSILRGMAHSGGGFVPAPGSPDPVVLDRRRANLLMVAALLLAIALGALLSI